MIETTLSLNTVYSDFLVLTKGYLNLQILLLNFCELLSSIFIQPTDMSEECVLRYNLLHTHYCFKI